MPHDTHDWDLPVTSPLFTATVGVEWSAPAYSPKLDLLVVPTVDRCGIFKRDDEPRFNGGGATVGGVISYAVNGKQYVAVVSGMAAGFWQAQPGSMTVTVFALP